MICGNRRDSILEMASGELRGVRAWSLRRHLTRCPSCREEWEETRALWRDLSTLRSEPVSEALSERVRAALPMTHPLAQESRERRAARIRRAKLAIVAAISLVVATTGGVAAMLGGGTGGCDFVLRGRAWQVRSDFSGEVSILDPDGRPAGGEIENWSPGYKGEVRVSVGQERFDFQAAGRREIRSADGVLLGYAVIRSIGPAEAWNRAVAWARSITGRTPRDQGDIAEAIRQETQNDWETWGETAQSGLRGVRRSSLGAMGYDNVCGVYWKVAGRAMARAVDAEGGLSAASPCLGSAPADGDGPELTAIIQGRVQRERGFGDHPLYGTDGKLRMTIEIAPLDQTP